MCWFAGGWWCVCVVVLVSGGVGGTVETVDDQEENQPTCQDARMPGCQGARIPSNFFKLLPAYLRDLFPPPASVDFWPCTVLGGTVRLYELRRYVLSPDSGLLK